MEKQRDLIYYLPKRGKLSRLIYFHRFFFPAIFLIIIFLSRLFLLGQTKPHLKYAFFVLITYVLYLLVIEIVDYRDHYPSLGHRILRVNIDLIYITASYLLIRIEYTAILFLFVLPVLSALNYKDNRHYFLCTTWPVIYFIIIQLYHYSRSGLLLTLIINILGFASIFYSIAIVLHTFDKYRSEKDDYFEKIKAFFQRARLSEHYSKTLNLLNSVLQEVTGVDIITLAFHDKQTNELYIVDSIGLPENFSFTRQSVNKGIVGASFREKKPILVQDVSRDARYIKIDDSIRSELAMPIKSNDKIIGVMNFESRKKDFFDGAVMGVIEIIYDHVIVLLRNAFEIYEYELSLRSKVDEHRETSLFLREIAHEMRNRLHIIIQLPEYLLETDSKNWNITLVKEQSQEIREGVQLLKSSLNTAIEGRRIYTPVWKTVRIGDIFDEIKNMIFLEVTKSFIKFAENVESGVDDRQMVTDKDYVVSIITNILVNSMKAYKDRGIPQHEENILTIERHTEGEKLLVVKVRDFAGGVKPDIARKMSDPSVFTVGNKTGLNVIKRYVAALRGNISYKIVDSSGTKGTEVEVGLPLTEDFERGKF